ncbi:MAG TPA: alanine racemase [Candidatus Avimonoglobus intestinipullorum]|uniref:Alanine racemase n=1 Tax=Candidatus Avimonoglobus intestinipullorum TaxID=2840699 RepID=A0A9D1S624_9FIRM|nr:alanine racemase [Candidatus Avimonoglobus intestinipullorum]
MGMNSRTWAEINLDALAHNMQNIRAATDKNAMVMAVVKADAYGHGVLECAKVLLENGADRLAVSCMDEAIQLRRAGFSVPVLILGALFEDEADDAVKYDITPTVFSKASAKLLSDAAVKQGKTAKAHIKIDTGMARIGYVAGIDDAAVVAEILEIAALPNLELEGIFTHFATADERQEDYTRLQFARFMKLCNMLEEAGLYIPVRHAANSAAVMMYPEMHLDMVRPGIILYGFYPSEEVDRTRLALEKVMTVKSRVTMVKQLGKEHGVSYGKEYITSRDTKIATVPIGYADGYTRLLKNKAKMIANGKIVPVIGRICMDQCMIDVTSVHNISTGDEVIIFGTDTITADDLAKMLGTISYEIICMIAKRIPRVYFKNGEAVTTLNYLSKL